jgi:hypothetical protein
MIYMSSLEISNKFVRPTVGSGMILAVRKLQGLALCLVVLFFLSACASPSSRNESQDYRARATAQKQGGVQVTAVVLSPKETQAEFNAPLARKNIQPIWLDIENSLDKRFYLMMLSIDPNYFAPSEVAWIMRNDDEGSSLEDKMNFYLDKHIPVIIPPHSKTSGFVYTNLNPGAKAYTIELFSENDARDFEFVDIIPGFEADFMRVDFDELYPAGTIKDLDLQELRKYLEELPCCVMGKDNKTDGDPLNLVIIGEGRHVLATLVRQGWFLTETIHLGTSWKTALSSVLGGMYKTSPVSPLYLFGRRHDAALQKARGNVNQRNHLRLWKAPVTFEGQPVWVGQISRDIGIRLSSKTLVTHKIDPVVDEARLYITLDLIAAGSLRAVGYVGGVGFANQESPQFNFTKDPYYTDGYRVVLFLSKKQINIEELHYLPWEQPNMKRALDRAIRLEDENHK